jgi:hypothetical protein
MSTAAVIVAVIGAALVAFGVATIRAPWARYQELKAQADNIARYESWRGGIRDSGTTGASVMIGLLRTQVRNAAIAIVCGAVFLFAALFLVR